MRRRGLLAIAAGTTASGLSGCLDIGSDGGTPTGTEEPDSHGTPTNDDTDATGTSAEDQAEKTPTEDSEGAETPTETKEETPGEPRLIDRDIEIQSVECGSGEDHWEVNVDDGVVTVDGIVGGNHACYSARIDIAEYDDDTDVLKVVIESFDDSRDGETCAECVVDIYYRATFTFEDGEPGDVEVQHDGVEDGSSGD